MFAVIKTGGKQYKVSVNTVLKLEKLAGDPGSKIIFDEVMLVSGAKNDVVIGSPFVKGATVTAEVLAQGKDSKVIIFKKQRRHNYRRKNGHRQEVTHVRIKDIVK